MNIILDTKELKLIQNLYDAATDLNCSSGDGEQEYIALECALIELENAGYTNGVFMPVNAHHDQSQSVIKAALELADMLVTGKASDADNEKVELIDALRDYVEAAAYYKALSMKGGA